MKRTKGLLTLAAVLAFAAVFAVWAALTSGAPVSLPETAAETVSAEEGRELSFLADGGEAPEGMKPVAARGGLTLYYHPETAEIAVLDGASGRVWRTNPGDRDTDERSTPYERDSLASQFVIDFRDDKTNLLTFRSYPDSVARGQMTAEALEDGLCVTYVLGDNSQGIDLMPKYISVARMEEAITSKLDEATARYVEQRYYKLKDNPDVLERLDDLVSKELVLKKMLEAFQQAGYGEEQLAIDNEANGVTAGGLADKPQFTVPLEYRLTEQGLKVEVAMDRVEENPKYPLLRMELLPYFGAAGSTAEGYMLVPDGSGAIIRLNNGKTGDDRYSQPLYGGDVNDSSRNRLQLSESARLPVFGMKDGSEAWYAAITAGDGVAGINADIGGKLNGYNHVHAWFQIRSEDELFMMSGNKLNEVKLTEARGYRGHAAVEYRFLSGEDADYSGMARGYQSWLLAEGKLPDISPAGEGSLPFHADVVGAISKRKMVLGVPRQGMAALTTLEEAREIAERLNAAGVSNLRMRLLGWSSGGVDHKPAAAGVQRAVGSGKELWALSDWLTGQGGGLYPDTAFQRVYRDTMAFSPAKDAARMITREAAEQSPYRADLNRMSELFYGSYYLLSPAKLNHFVEEFRDDYVKLGVPSLALRDLGDLLYGDYRVSLPVDRDTAKAATAAQLAGLADSGLELMAAGGNGYALPYVKHVVDAPLDSSGFQIVDEDVPFYQMVLHGHVAYSGKALNLSPDQDTERALLNLLEYGAAPHFVFTRSASSEVKFTKFDYLYATRDEDWLEEAAALYRQANEVLGPLQQLRMTGHRTLREGLHETEFEDGTLIVVNYNDRPERADGVTVGPRGYAVKGGAGWASSSGH